MQTSITDVKKIFDETINTIFKNKPDVRDFILKHERKEYCLNQLCAQITRAEKYLLVFDVGRYRTMIIDVAKMFANAVVNQHRQNNMTHLERSRIVSDADRLKRAEEHLIDLEKEAMSALEHQRLEDERKRRTERQIAKAEADRKRKLKSGPAHKI